MIIDTNCYFTKTPPTVNPTNPVFVIHILYPTFFPNNVDTTIVVTTEFAERYNGILLPTVAGYFYLTLNLN